MAGCSISDIRRQGLLLRLRILRGTRHSLRRRWAPLFQGLLHWRLYWFHIWQWPFHVQGIVLLFICNLYIHFVMPKGIIILKFIVEKLSLSTIFPKKMKCFLFVQFMGPTFVEKQIMFESIEQPFGLFRYSLNCTCNVTLNGRVRGKNSTQLDITGL